MKNLSNFKSFVSQLNESTLEWDPKKAEAAIKKAMEQTGGSMKDKDPTGLSFKNIQDVFGKSDYTIRYVIAQALKLAGRDLFPTNSYNPNLSDNKKKESENKDKPFYFNTYYIGEKDQNLMLDKISQPVLTVVKPLVSLILSSPMGIEEKYFKSSASSLPEVAKAKVELSKIK